MHLHIGRLMRSALTDEEFHDEIFTIAGHFNLGAELLSEQAERDALAELNFMAGSKALSSAAHGPALDYLEQGLALLGEERWSRCYTLTLGLHTQAAEASFLSTGLSRMEKHAAEVLRHARNALDQIKVYEVKIQAYILQHRFNDAVLIARRILALLGIEFPNHPTAEDVVAALAETRAAIGERLIEDFLELPTMTDPVMLAAMRLFAMITSAAYIGSPALFPLIVLRQIVIASEYGNTGASAYGYALYSILLESLVGDIDSAYATGQVALRVLERYEAREYVPRTHNVWNMHIRHWKDHLRTTLHGLQDVYKTGLEVGDLEFAGWGGMMRQSHAFFLGQELVELDQSTAKWVQAFAKQESARYFTSIVHQTIQNLRALSEQPCALVGAAYDERKMLPIHLAANDAFGLAMFFTYKVQLCVLFGQPAEALEHATRAAPYMGALSSTVLSLNFLFFEALAHLAVFTHLSTDECVRSMARIEESAKKIQARACHAPMNYGAKSALLAAERHRVLNEPEHARAGYYRAVELAREHGYRNDEALATELFSSFLRQRGEHEFAHLFLAKARHLYHLWGAEAKVVELDRCFPELRAMTAQPVAAAALTPRATVSTTTRSDNHSSRALDRASVIKASQAISGEVVITTLLEKLVHLVVENAGARSGILVLEGERPFFAVARSLSRDGANTVTLHDTAAQLPIEFSQAIMRYVERTHEVVVLGDASREGAFQSDVYVRNHQPKSVLCMPILYSTLR